MIKLLVLVSLFFANYAYTQTKEDCKTNFYKGRLISKYDIYEVEALNFDTLSIKYEEILRILDAFKDDKVITAINNIVINPIFSDLVNKYALSTEHDQFSLDLYANKFKDKDIYTDYIKNKNVLDSTTKRFITNKNKILNISLYTNLDNYGDCYFYQMGYNDFNFKTVSNAVITSVLYGIENPELNKNRFVGIEVTETGKIIIIPLVSNGKYVCDIRLMLCPDN